MADIIDTRVTAEHIIMKAFQQSGIRLARGAAIAVSLMLCSLSVAANESKITGQEGLGASASITFRLVIPPYLKVEEISGSTSTPLIIANTKDFDASQYSASADGIYTIALP